MTAQELRASLLREAVTGRLVPQRAEEGSAETLYEEIRQEKARLVAGKKIKKEKPLPPVTEEEQPFSIPATWKWVRIGDIFHLQAGKNITSSHIFSSYSAEHPYICYGGNGIRGYVKNYNNEGNFAIIGRQGAYCGNIKFATGKFYATEHAVIVHTFSDTNVDWSGLFLEALNLNQYSTSTAQPGLSVSKIMHYLIPLPPLAEQKRIMDKLEELLPLVDAYGEAEQRLAAYEDRFPDALKRSLLQEAITGRLVPQRAEEGSAESLYEKIRQEKASLVAEKKIKKEKPLPPIMEEEQPFPIPATWKWVRLGSIMINRDSERVPLSVAQRAPLKKIYDYYGASGVIDKVDNYLFDKTLLLIGEDGANLLTRSKPIAFLATGKYWVNNHAHVLDCPASLLNLKYVMFFINAINLSPYVTGTAQPKMNQEKMNSILIPLPPLAEQKRIVDKLEELLALAERIREACR